MIYRGPGFLAVLWFGSSPACCLPFMVFLFVAGKGRGEGGGRGAKSCAPEIAWPSTYHSILSGSFFSIISYLLELHSSPRPGISSLFSVTRTVPVALKTNHGVADPNQSQNSKNLHWIRIWELLLVNPGSASLPPFHVLFTVLLQIRRRSCPAVFRIHDILVWIRIRGSMPLTNGSGCGSRSFYFHHWPSRCQQKTNFFLKFSCVLLF